MKRNKIFLGVTTTLLAVAGIAAANQHHKTKTLFYTTVGSTCSGGTLCTKISLFNLYTASTSAAPIVTTGGVGGRFQVCYTTTGGTCIAAHVGD